MIKTTQPVIVLDPGHGGLEKGLVTSGGLQEKIICLKLALKTAKKLEKRYTVLLTRNQDVKMSARQRVVFTNKNRADLFICLHLHNSDIPSGFFYYFVPPSPPEKNSRIVNYTPWKLQPLLYQSQSKKAIRSFLSVFSANKKKQRFISKGAPVKCLEGTTMPAILIEPFSISLLPQNPDETEKILDEYALLISKSIDMYFKKN